MHRPFVTGAWAAARHQRHVALIKPEVDAFVDAMTAAIAPIPVTGTAADRTALLAA